MLLPPGTELLSFKVAGEVHGERQGCALGKSPLGGAEPGLRLPMRCDCCGLPDHTCDVQMILTVITSRFSGN